MDARPYRSVLYIPGSKARALEKARSLPTDAIIFDLEDAVAATEKAAGRSLLADALAGTDYGPRACLIRINGLDTVWGAADLEAMAGLVLGTNDLARELGCRFRPDRLPLLAALQTCLMAARAAGIVALDGVYNALRDDAGLRAECEQGRDMGFDGKTLIHPAQLEIANTVFAPDAEELALAERQIEAWQDAVARGEGVAVVDGRIVENLHIEIARRSLARAAAIAKLEEVL